MDIKLSPSLLSADFANLESQVRETEKSGAEYLHIDVMDGGFVPNITLGPCVISAIRPHTSLVFDVHLMINEPIRYIGAFAEAGADIITVHCEACADVAATLEAIRAAGCRAGLSVKPATPVEAVRPFLSLCDLILIMSVEPGFGGQKYIPGSEAKAAALRSMLDAEHAACEIEMDGGLNPSLVPLVVRAGVGVIVAGSAFYGSGDLADAARRFRAAAKTV